MRWPKRPRKRHPMASLKIGTNHTPKAGVKTSEFWGKTIVQASILLAMVTGVADLEISPDVAIGAVAFVEGVYAYVRGRTKGAEAVAAVAVTAGKASVAT